VEPTEKTSLLVPLEAKDDAKLITAESPEGRRRILWDGEKEEWFWPGPPESLPPELQKFLPGEGTPTDTVLAANHEIYQSLKAELQENQQGRMRFDTALQRPIWRGWGPLPSSLEPFRPPTGSTEEILSTLINWPLAKVPSKRMLVETCPHQTSTSVEIHGDNRSLSITPDQVPALLMWRQAKLKKPLTYRIIGVTIQGDPGMPFHLAPASCLLQLATCCRQTRVLVPPDANPLNLLHTLPELSRKYKRELRPEDYPKVLQAFGLQLTRKALRWDWIPNPEKDQKFLNALPTRRPTKTKS
jgi:hypothetical protein